MLRHRQFFGTATWLAIVSLAWIGLPLAPSGRSAHADDGAGRPRWVPNRVLVAFHDHVPLAQRLRVCERYGLLPDPANTSPYFATLNFGPAVTARGVDVADMVALLRQDPAIRVVEPDYLCWPAATPNDPQFPQQWGLRNTGQPIGTPPVVGRPDADIDADEAWDVLTGNDTIIVAVIDTGVDTNHPDLQENILKDSNGNIIGYDFGMNDPIPDDPDGHGTHVAGIIGARGNNAIGVTGVCQQVKIMPLRASDASGALPLSATIQAIDFARRNGARVTNHSYGGDTRVLLEYEAFRRLRDAGILAFCSAGNAAEDNDAVSHYPSDFSTELENIVAVAATNNRDDLASFSNYGRQSVNLAAPGHDILGTLPNNAYGFMSGTSMATPMAAGAAALVWGFNPQMTYTEVKGILMGTCDVVTSLVGKVVAGRLNVNSAIRSAIPPNNPPTARVSPSSATVSEMASVRLDASASSDPDGDALTFRWRQVSGPTVNLTSPPGQPAEVTFTAPLVATSARIVVEVTVRDARASATALSTIDVVPASPGLIGGRVVDENNNPVRGATVFAVREDGVTSATTTTDDNGNFVVNPARIGRHTVHVEDQLHEATTATATVSSGMLSITEPDPIRLTVLAGTLQGVVRSSAGVPLAGARVQVFDGGGNAIRSATTAPDGSYRIPGMSARVIRDAQLIRVSPDDLIPWLEALPPLTIGADNRLDFLYADLHLTLTIKRVKGQPRPRFPVDVDLVYSGEVVASAEVNRSTSRLRFQNLPASLFLVRVTPKGGPTRQFEIRLMPGRVNSARVTYTPGLR